jgi:hypothetical protein
MQHSLDLVVPPRSLGEGMEGKSMAVPSVRDSIAASALLGVVLGAAAMLTDLLATGDYSWPPMVIVAMTPVGTVLWNRHANRPEKAAITNGVEH